MCQISGSTTGPVLIYTLLSIFRDVHSDSYGTRTDGIDPNMLGMCLLTGVVVHFQSLRVISGTGQLAPFLVLLTRFMKVEVVSDLEDSQFKSSSLCVPRFIWIGQRLL